MKLTNSQIKLLPVYTVKLNGMCENMGAHVWLYLLTYIQTNGTIAKLLISLDTRNMLLITI